MPSWSVRAVPYGTRKPRNNYHEWSLKLDLLCDPKPLVKTRLHSRPGALSRPAQAAWYRRTPVIASFSFEVEMRN